MDYKEVIQRNLVLFLLLYSYIVLQIDVMILYLFASVHQLAHRMIYTLDYSIEKVFVSCRTFAYGNGNTGMGTE